MSYWITSKIFKTNKSALSTRENRWSLWASAESWEISGIENTPDLDKISLIVLFNWWITVIRRHSILQVNAYVYRSLQGNTSSAALTARLRWTSWVSIINNVEQQWVSSSVRKGTSRGDFPSSDNSRSTFPVGTRRVSVCGSKDVQMIQIRS